MELTFNLLIVVCVWGLIWFLLFYEQTFLPSFVFWLWLLGGIGTSIYLTYSFFKRRKK